MSFVDLVFPGFPLKLAKHCLVLWGIFGLVGIMKQKRYVCYFSFFIKKMKVVTYRKNIETIEKMFIF